MWIWIGAILIILLCWTLQGQRSNIRKNGKRLPRPPGTLPFAGNGLWFLEPRHKLLDWFADNQPRMGLETFEISVPSLLPTIVINDPKNVEHVLKNNEIFIKGEFFRTRSWDLFGNGIINADGDFWKVQRKAGLRFFSNANLKKFIDNVLPPILEDTKKTLTDAANSQSVVDFQEVMLELTTRLMGRVAFDMDVTGSMPFSKAFDYASGVTGDRFVNPFWRTKEFFLGSRMRRAVAEVSSFGNEVVSSTKQKHQAATGDSKGEKNASPLENNLINSLLVHITDDQMVADATMNFLSAGRDTTAQALTWTFYNLMRHPDAGKDILRELSSTFSLPDPASSTSAFSSSSSSSSPDTLLPLSYEATLPLALPQTYATFSETIRLYPPVPMEIKESTSDSTFPDGTFLPTRSVVLWVPWALGRSPDIWGKDAAEFKPRRWIITTPTDNNNEKHDNSTDETNEKNQTSKKTAPIITLLSKTAFENPVFNGGPRMCLGKKMAESMAVYVTAALVWAFEFEEVRDPKLGGVKEGMGRVCSESLTLPMQGGLPCRVRLRKRGLT